MQSTATVISKVKENLHQGNRKKGYFQRNKIIQKGSSKIQVAGYGFLRNRIKSRKSVNALPEFCEENYLYLYESAKNYLTLLGSSIPESCVSFSVLYRTLKNQLYPDQVLHIVRDDDGKLFFRIQYEKNFLVYEVCFIPCKILSETSGKFREILLHLFRMFSSQGIVDLYDEVDYEMLSDYLSYEYSPKEEYLEESKLLFSYDKGNIRGIFNEINAKPCDLNSFSEVVNSYIPQNSKERKLLESIKKGIEIFSLNKCLRNYVYDGINDVSEEDRDIGDYFVLSVDRLMRIVYDLNDIVTEQLLYCVNEDNNQYGYSDFIPASSLDLSPETAEVLAYGYPELFFGWLFDLISKLDENE